VAFTSSKTIPTDERSAKQDTKTFFVWEAQLELFKLESSVILLQRILKGDLGRSGTMFALLQINPALQYKFAPDVP
jgi:hypothetical protein